MTPSVFEGLRSIAHERAGFSVRPGKEALVTARLAKRIRGLGLRDEREYLRYLRSAPAAEVTAFLDAIATNVTSFFREPEHLAALARHVDERVADGARRIRVWSAACSTGEEPLSMAMVLEDVLGATSMVDWMILATDLSTTALDHLRRARYSAEDAAKIPETARLRHMVRVDGGFEPRPHITRRLTATRLNLAKAPYPIAGPLDAVFCRNAMIYLSPETKQRVVREVERVLRPGGIFAIGHSETLHGLDTTLRYVQPSLYVKPRDPQGAGIS